MYEAIDELISASTYISKLDVSIVSLDGSYAFQRHAVPELVAELITIIVDQKPITLSHDGHINILVYKSENKNEMY